MCPAGFEPAISASEWPQIYAADRAANEIGDLIVILIIIWQACNDSHIISVNNNNNNNNNRFASRICRNKTHLKPKGVSFSIILSLQFVKLLYC